MCVRSSHFFSETVHYFFSETLQLFRACKREKNVPSAFLIILAILAKNWPKLAIWLDVCNSLFKGWKYLKNMKVGGFETDFEQVPFVFRQTTCTYSESWRPVENLCDPPTPPRGGQKTTENIFSGQYFDPLILPKKHIV